MSCACTYSSIVQPFRSLMVACISLLAVACNESTQTPEGSSESKPDTSNLLIEAPFEQEADTFIHQVPEPMAAPDFRDSIGLLLALQENGFDAATLYRSQGYLPDLESYAKNTFYSANGDFFNDGINDVVSLVRFPSDTVRLVYLDYTFDSVRTVVLGNADDPFSLDDYAWARRFKGMEPGSELWSNYTDERRDFQDIPKEEIVVLDYDALYVHESDACGGGFIYWQDGEFHWLQQE